MPTAYAQSIPFVHTGELPNTPAKEATAYFPKKRITCRLPTEPTDKWAFYVSIKQKNVGFLWLENFTTDIAFYKSGAIRFMDDKNSLWHSRKRGVVAGAGDQKKEDTLKLFAKAGVGVSSLAIFKQELEKRAQPHSTKAMLEQFEKYIDPLLNLNNNNPSALIQSTL